MQILIPNLVQVVQGCTGHERNDADPYRRSPLNVAGIK